MCINVRKLLPTILSMYLFSLLPITKKKHNKNTKWCPYKISKFGVRRVTDKISHRFMIHITRKSQKVNRCQKQRRYIFNF